MFPAQAQQPVQPAPAPQPPASSWNQPHLGTTPGAPAGGAFGGSAGGAGRSISAPPGMYSARPGTVPPGSQFSVPAAPVVGAPSQFSAPSTPAGVPYAPAPTPPPPAQHSYVAPNVTVSTSGAGISPLARPATTAEPAKKKSKLGLIIAIGAVVVVGGGIGLAVGLSGGGGKKLGKASRDEVVQGTLAALAAGDGDALLALTATESANDLFECEDDAKRGELEKMLAKLRSEMTKVAAKAKGLQIELVKTGEPHITTQKPGGAFGSCKLKVELKLHEVSLTLKIKKGDVTREQTKPIALTEVDGRWFLASAPTIRAPGDCKAAAKVIANNEKATYTKFGVGDSGLARLESAFAKHCVDDEWTEDVIACVTNATDPVEDGICLAMMPKAKQGTLATKLAQILAEDLKSREVVATPPTTPTQDLDPTLPPDAGSGSGASGSGAPADDPAPIPPICDDYRAELEKLAKCRRIKVDIRAGAKKRYDLIVEGWGKVRDKEKIRESTENLCRTGVELVLDLRKHLCR